MSTARKTQVAARRVEDRAPRQMNHPLAWATFFRSPRGDEWDQQVIANNKQNSAARLLTIFNSLRHRPANGVGQDVWAAVLEIEENAHPSKERRLVSQLEAIIHEVELVKEGLANLEVPEQLYSPTMAALIEAASPAIIRTTWNNPVREEYLLCMGWAQYVLPCEGEVVEAAAIEDLLAILQDLKQQITVADFPTPLRVFLEKHIREIEKALDNYSISGSLPLASALDGLHAGVVGRKESLGEAYQRGTDKQKSTFERLATFAKTAEQLVKSTESLARFSMLACEKGSLALEWFKQ
ncbi:hypothetical protein LJR296_008096 [Cupriavidus necator]|uniref:hypothetical protein n=1 Tax=Cupriavidus necator TaxID=106590 RepID=UPI003ECF823E